MNKMEGEKSKNMKVKYLKQQMQRQNLKKQAKGITLIALVITIVLNSSYLAMARMNRFEKI